MSPRLPLRALSALALASLAATAAALAAQDATPAEPVVPAAAPIATMSALAFTPDGTLLVGDARSAAVFAVDLGERPRTTEPARFAVADVETKVAALLGARAEDVLVHDLAVDPLSLDVYLAVSRNRGRWTHAFALPNDLGDATELVRIGEDGRLYGVDLAGKAWTKADLPKVVPAGSAHPWKEGVDLRTEAITDLAWDDGQVWVAGLSNEEFSSALWRLPYPLDGASATVVTVENYHVAHEKWETEAPIRALVPYRIGGKRHLVAAYLCTPLVLFETETLVDGSHVRGRTVGELGSNNYPLDLVAAATGKGDRLFLANSNLPLMVIDPQAIERFEGALTEPTDAYTAGIPVEYRPGSGIQQLDLRGGAQLVALRRLPNGTLGLETWPIAR
jgi:hypothetical protein